MSDFFLRNLKEGQNFEMKNSAELQKNLTISFDIYFLASIIDGDSIILDTYIRW